MHPCIKVGDTVSIIAPSWGWPHMHQVRDFLRSKGLNMHAPTDLNGETDVNAIPFSNSLELRTQHIINALASPDNNIIWSIRGGSGASAVIPYLIDKQRDFQNMKILMGFSDFTAMHIFANCYLQWPTIHCPNLKECVNRSVSHDSISATMQIIFGCRNEIQYPIKSIHLGNTNVTGFLVGGNLSVITSSIGTCWQIDTRRNVIFIEEVGEKIYSIHRNIVHLQQANIFQNAKAVIFGNFEKCGSRLEIDEFLLKVSRDIDLPTFRVSKIGHGLISNPIILGNHIEIRDNKLQIFNFLKARDEYSS